MVQAKSPQMQARYDAVVKAMKARYGLRVNKWRSSTTGCAWEVHYHDGTISRLIESPYPRGPMSAAIFLHEVGHHAIGLGTYKPRCLEEFKAWEWSLNAMREFDLNVTPAVERRMYESLHYALEKACRRGLKKIPAELEVFVTPLQRTRRAATVLPKDSTPPSTQARSQLPVQAKSKLKPIKPKKKSPLLWLFPIH